MRAHQLRRTLTLLSARLASAQSSAAACHRPTISTVLGLGDLSDQPLAGPCLQLGLSVRPFSAGPQLQPGQNEKHRSHRALAWCSNSRLWFPEYRTYTSPPDGSKPPPSQDRSQVQPGQSPAEQDTGSSQPDATAITGVHEVADAFERLIWEAYKLLGEGEMEKAELLLMEGINSLEPELGKEAVEIAQLWDQLALILFFQDKLEEAEPAAKRSLEIAQTHFQPRDAPLAMCQLRLGSILLAQGRARDALQPLEAAREVLQASLGTDYEAVGEAQFYSALANLHLTDRSDTAAVDAFDPDLLQGLEQLKQNAGAGALLTATALREHYRVLEGEMAQEHWPAVAALFRQQMRLVASLNPASEDLSLLAYQFGTLLFCQGSQEEAKTLINKSLEIARSLYTGADDQILLRVHRLGTIISAQPGEQAEARLLLQRSYKHFSKRLGADNPLVGEGQAYVALIELSLLLEGHDAADAFTRVLNPAKQKKLREDMKAGIKAMRQGFGEDHLLVQKVLAEEQRVLALCNQTRS